MVARNSGHTKKRFSTRGGTYLCSECDRTTTQNQELATEKRIKVRFHLPVRVDKNTLAKKMVIEMQKSPLGRLITAIATTPELRPEKMEQGEKILRCSDSDLNEKLIQTMERVLEELSYAGAADIKQ